MIEFHSEKQTRKVLVIYKRSNGSFGLMLNWYDPDMKNWVKCLIIVSHKEKGLILETALIYPSCLKEYQQRIRLNTILFSKKNDMVFNTPIKVSLTWAMTKHPEILEDNYCAGNIYIPETSKNLSSECVSKKSIKSFPSATRLIHFPSLISKPICPNCRYNKPYKNGTNLLKRKKIKIQKYYCKKCGRSFQRIHQ